MLQERFDGYVAATDAPTKEYGKCIKCGDDRFPPGYPVSATRHATFHSLY